MSRKSWDGLYFLRRDLFEIFTLWVSMYLRSFQYFPWKKSTSKNQTLAQRLIFIIRKAELEIYVSGITEKRNRNIKR